MWGKKGQKRNEDRGAKEKEIRKRKRKMEVEMGGREKKEARANRGKYIQRGE